MENNVIKWSESSIWGSWNRLRINGVMRQKTLCEVRVGVLDKKNRKYSDHFTWVGVSGNKSLDYYDTKGVYKTDFHSISGNYSKIGLYIDDFKFDLEFAADGDDFIYKVIPRVFSENYEIFTGFLIGSQKKIFEGGNLTLKDNGCIFESAEYRHEIDIDGEKSETEFEAPYPGLFFKSSSCIYIRCNNRRDLSQADEFLKNTRDGYVEQRVFGEGFLAEGIVESVIMAMSWNKVYDNFHDTFKSDVTRLWAPESCYYTFYWDNFFTSLLYGLEDEKMAYDQVDSVCSEFKNGFLPQASWEWGSSSMINPPVGSYVLLKLYRQYGNRSLLECYFDRLYSTNTHLLNKRSFFQDGVLQLKEWLDIDESNAFNDVLATGLDNSPMYDNAKNSNLNDIGMSSIYALDCRMLSIIAEILGRNEEKVILHERYNTAKKTINDLMWDEEAGIYCNTTMEGEFCKAYSPTSFYPMLAGIADTGRSERLIKEHLLNDNEFWGEYIIPSIARNHQAFYDQDYWRGCAWPPMNFIVYEGLKNLGFYEIAHEFAMKTLTMYRQNWVDYGWVPENFSTKTGGITKNCAPMYTWGGLMAYIPVEEVFEAMPEGGLKFGNLSDKDAAVRNLRVGSDLLDIITGKQLSVYKNGHLYMTCDTPVIIRNFIIKDNTLQLEIIADMDGKFTLYEEFKEIHIMQNNQTEIIRSIEGKAEYLYKRVAMYRSK